MPRRSSAFVVILALAPVAAGLTAIAVGAGVSAARGDDAGPAFVFEGRGFGHGVGMSQYGARGRAQAGWATARILAHYYPGTRLTRAAAPPIRVRLSSDASAVHVSSARPWRAVGPRASGTRRTALAAGGTYRLRPLARGRVLLERDGRRIALFTGAVRLSASAGEAVAWGPRRPERARRYRGTLQVGPAGAGRLSVTNVVGVEDYLRGVVPREMSPSWADGAAAALRAQAVAARSYALSSLRPSAAFDVHDDTRSQVYGGVAAEDRRSDAAVAATRRRVLTYDGGIITAYFHSTSGGRTEDVQNAWPGSAPRPYLVSVDDGFDRVSPYHSWASPPRFTAGRLGDLLGVGAPVAAVTVLRRGASPRVLEARITTTTGDVTIMSGADIRARLGLMDTWFSVRT